MFYYYIGAIKLESPRWLKLEGDADGKIYRLS